MRPVAVSVVVALIISVAAVVRRRPVITTPPRGSVATAPRVVRMARFVAVRRGVPGVVIAAASSSRIVRRAGSVTIALVLVTRAALLVPKVNVARLGIQRLIDSTVSGVPPVEVIAPVTVPVGHVPAFSTAIVAIVSCHWSRG